MTLSNQCLTIPPDHPLAKELYDLIGLQGELINRMNSEGVVVNAGGDRNLFDKLNIATSLVNEKIETVLKGYRVERGDDETCTVGLTYDGNGYPVVKGRPGGPKITLN